MCGSTSMAAYALSVVRAASGVTSDFLDLHPELYDNITWLRVKGVENRRILTLLNEGKPRGDKQEKVAFRKVAVEINVNYSTTSETAGPW